MKWPKFNTIKEVPSQIIDMKPSMYFKSNVIKKIKEQFKGEVENKKVKFPAELGEEHPYDFQMMETLYKKFGFFTAVIDKYIDYVVGPGFYIETDDERAKKILEEFMKDVNFDTLLRQWTKEALMKGNGFLEMGMSKEKGIEGLKILNANYMYVNRDKLGKIEGYKQYKGAFDKFAKEKTIDFGVDQIAHVPFNIVGDCAYGLGIGYTAMALIDNWLSQTKSEHKLMDRKANAPLHAKFGYIDGDTKLIPKPEDVDAFGKELETMDNKTNWVTDPLVEFKVIDFGDIGDKFDSILEKDLEMMMYAFQIPAVIMGKANVPEGIAKVQMDAFQRRIQSIQAELEKIIENKIFKKVLSANGLDKTKEGLDVDVEFEWGSPSIMAIEGRMSLLTEMIKSPNTGYAMKTLMEDELINLLKLDKDKWEELKLEQEAKEEEEQKRLEAEAQPRVPGQNASFPKKPVPNTSKIKQPKPIAPGKPPTPIKQSIEPVMKEINELKDKIDNIKIDKRTIIKKSNILPESKIHKCTEDCNHEENFDNYNTIEEWLGFNYKKYLGEILAVLKVYDFDMIKGVNEAQLSAGYLNDEQVGKLKTIMDKGFRKGKSMSEMSKEVQKKVGIKDLYRMDNAETIKKGAAGLPILSKSADKRPIGIIRTEVTKLANEGAVKYYKDNDIKSIKHIASYGARTCPECESLNGMIYEIGTEPGLPIHPMCRCTYGPVVELK